MSVRGVSIFWFVLSCAVAASAVTTEDLYVAQGATVTRDSTYAGVYNTSLTNSGTLVFSVGGNGTYHFAGKESPGYSDYYTTHLAPNAGDEGVLRVASGSVGGLVGNNVHGHMYVGDKGGGDKAKITLNKGSLYLRTFALSANARTTADEFNLVDIHPGSSLIANPLINYNTKPVVVNFTNDTASTEQSTSFFGQFYEQAILAPRNGDIILRGLSNAPVRLATWSGTKMSLFSGNNASNVVIEGNCDIEINCGKNWVALNSSRIVYRNSGNLNLTCTKDKAAPFKLSYADTLPWGVGRGYVCGTTASSSSANFYIDLQGKDQKLNGLVLANGAYVTNTTGSATLTFGTDNVAGKISGDVTASSISCVKVGTGDLTLDNAQVCALTVNGGRLLVRGSSASTVGTLALNNVDTTGYGYATGAELAADTIQGEFPATAEYVGEGWSNCVTEISMPAKAFVKQGKGLLTCVSPANARGMKLRVQGGTLRMGGEATPNKFWRIIFKESQGGCTFTLPVGGRSDFPNGGPITISLAVGNVGLFGGDGRNVIGMPYSSAQPGTSPSSLSVYSVMAEPRHFSNNNGYYAQGTVNPIANGANYDNVKYAFEDTPGALSNTYDRVNIGGWWGGVLFTNQTLVANDPTTWKTLTWRLSPTNAPACSYNLARATNFNDDQLVQATAWELQSSPTGADGTWVTMDERSNQAVPKGAVRFDYNGHVPYLFSSRKSNWRFDTFGAVEVDAGATLDLSEIPAENIAINALKVDMAAGAGRITRFVPAAGGTLELTNIAGVARPDGKIKGRVELPLTLGEVSSAANLASWTVTVNGEPSTDSKVLFENGKLQVRTGYGLFVIVK